MGTDRGTRARIAALVAAEVAIEYNARDPRTELGRISVVAARAIKADPETVHRLADEIVVKVFRAELNKPHSLELLCLSCGAPLATNDRLVCTECEPEFLSEEEP